MSTNNDGRYLAECLYLLNAIETAEQHIAYGRIDDASKILYTAAHTHRNLYMRYAIPTIVGVRDELINLRDRNADLRSVLLDLVVNVQDYEAWQRPCHALDKAREALRKDGVEPQ